MRRVPESVHSHFRQSIEIKILFMTEIGECHKGDSRLSKPSRDHTAVSINRCTAKGGPQTIFFPRAARRSRGSNNVPYILLTSSNERVHSGPLTRKKFRPRTGHRRPPLVLLQELRTSTQTIKSKPGHHKHVAAFHHFYASLSPKQTHCAVSRGTGEHR